MAKATFHFPSGILWGTATSAYQVEGHMTQNNWTAWEQAGHIIDGTQAGSACDWWSGRWREDFDRAAEANQNTHRFSVEWSRIQPTPDRWDDSALENYRQMVRGLVERGLTPMLTLHHFTIPGWLAKIGGWEHQDSPQYFQAFVRRVVEATHEYVPLWCTINEPNVLVASSYLLGTFPPGENSLLSLYRVVVNLVKAHVLAYQAIHEISPHARVGLAHQYRGFTPAKTWSPLDKWSATRLDQLFNQSFPGVLHTGSLRLLGLRKAIPQAKGTQDFFGINYYTRDLVWFDLAKPDSLFTRNQVDSQGEVSPTGFIANHPQTFFQGLRWASSFGLPVYITENGVEDDEDRFRRRYLVQHIHQMWRAVNFNWPIRAYYHWTLVDNFEWERGWTQPFGLWALDRETQTRQKRSSTDLYQAICQHNALSSNMVQEFTPDLLPVLFPG
jgi:beta-glucosidase